MYFRDLKKITFHFFSYANVRKTVISHMHTFGISIVTDPSLYGGCGGTCVTAGHLYHSHLFPGGGPSPSSGPDCSCDYSTNLLLLVGTSFAVSIRERNNAMFLPRIISTCKW